MSDAGKTVDDKTNVQEVRKEIMTVLARNGDKPLKVPCARNAYVTNLLKSFFCQERR